VRRLLVFVALIATAPVSRASIAGETASMQKSKAVNSQDPLVVGPNVYRLVLENDRVRVLEARLQPGEKIGPHTHPDHVMVVTSAGKLAVTNREGTTVLDAKVGDTFFVPAETHSVQNIGTTEFVCVVTELKGEYKVRGQASPNPGTIEVQQGKVGG
jgi:quercetin dioxygenase-like cupin family protein